jgi:ribonuclease P/MRP protein subunit POP1
LDSFELVGPMSEEVLSRVLRPVKGEVSLTTNGADQTLSFGQDIQNGIYSLNIYDPRLQ